MMSNLTEMKLKWWWYVGWYYNQVTVEYENIWKIGMILDKIEKLFQSNFPQPGKMSLNVCRILMCGCRDKVILLCV